MPLTSPLALVSGARRDSSGKLTGELGHLRAADLIASRLHFGEV